MRIFGVLQRSDVKISKIGFGRRVEEMGAMASCIRRILQEVFGELNGRDLTMKETRWWIYKQACKEAKEDVRKLR